MLQFSSIIKKLTIFLLILALCFSCGCSGEQVDSSAGSSSDIDKTETKPNVNVASRVDSSAGSSSDIDKTGTKPTVTVASQVGNGVFIVAGYCSMNTEKIIISGQGLETVETVPFDGEDKRYFMTQVPSIFSTEIEVKAVETGVKEPAFTTARINHIQMKENYMYKGQYSPVIGLNGQTHYYSALLSYSLTTDKVTPTMSDIAYRNITEIVNTSKALGAKKTIFLVIPSSADVYPETVPSDFKKANGERLYERFSKIATDCGAEVIYPLDTMKAHTNDGKGFQIYQHTDSHWSTYGAYWGTYDLFNIIAKDFPQAKPRTVSQMGFYTTEMHGGDTLFSFPKEARFEEYYSDKTTRVTKIMELTTRYNLKMPTSTLNSVYTSNKCLYLSEENSAAAKETNPNGEGLPTALIMRDSFGKVSYDMMNDRFSTVYWGEFNNYNMPLDLVGTDKLDYVIYLYSERNLLKIMLNDADVSMLNLK